MSELVIVLPPRYALNIDQPLEFCLFDGQQQLIQKDTALLNELPHASSITLLIDPSDCTLLLLNVPPITGVRLKQALPNMVEEHVLGDLDKQHIALGAANEEQKRWVGLVDKTWLTGLLRFFLAHKRKIKQVIPLSLRLPIIDNGWTIWRGSLGACLRTKHHVLALPTDSQDFQTALLLAQAQLPKAEKILLLDRAPMLTFEADYTHHDFDYTKPSSDEFNLLQFDLLNLNQQLSQNDPERKLFTWRWSILSAALAILMWVAGLNVYKFKLLNEEQKINEQMRSQYLAVFPGAQVTDPYSSTMSKQQALSASSGEFTNGDFLIVMEAIAKVMQQAPPESIKDINYQADLVTIKLKPSFKIPDTEKNQWIQRFSSQGLKANLTVAGEISVSLQGN